MAATTAQVGTTGLLGHAELHAVPEEQVRLAVVLNGGVSLAVWMGGVVLELDRLTKADPAAGTPYSVLKRLTGCAARVDVITGTSAGGINGAALALTQVNRHASPSALRDLWIEQGRFENLLRQPFRGQPRSLLQGDEYFLPALNAALGRLARGTGHVGPDEAPVDLTITTTVIGGNQAVSVDSMGQPLPQRLHAGRFRFRRRAGMVEDPFAEDRLARTADRLALASRSSASFPFAFEPSYVPVFHPDYRDRPGVPLTPEQKLRPDMGDHVEFWGNPGMTTNRSRYCADGGALSNTPTREALQAIEEMPAAGPVRRVVLLVFPHAPAEEQDPPDERDEPFELTQSLTGLLGALTAQGSRSYVEELERHNLTVSGRRGTRNELLQQLLEPTGGGPAGPDALTALTGSVYGQYRRLRQRRIGRNLAAWRTGMTPDGLMGATLPDKWSYERVRSAAVRAQHMWESDADGSPADVLPYVPASAPTVDHFRITVGQWDWGIDAALGVAEGAADLLRRLVWILPKGEDFEAVNAARLKVFGLAQQIREARHLTDDAWETDPTLLELPPTRAYWTLRLAFYAYLMTGAISEDAVAERVEKLDEATAEVARAVAAALQDHGRLRAPASAGAEVRRLVEETVDVLLTCVRSLERHAGTAVGKDAGLPGWHALLHGTDRLTALTRLMQLEVVSTALGDEVVTGASIPVELVQVSAETQNPFATITTHGREKLGGDAINRFGGFLKRSWRVNDWIWGRADGATMLARTLLDPKRVRRAALVSGYIVRHEPTGKGDAARVKEIHQEQARRCADRTLADVLAALGFDAEAFPADARAAGRELSTAFDLTVADADLPSAMPSLANIFAWALHLDSLPSELPALAAAIVGDRVDGANPRSRSEQFVAQHDELLRRLGDPHHAADEEDSRRALAAFDGAGIGSEPLHEEAGSDLLIRTVTSAAAVVTTVADSSGSGLGALKPVTRTLRGGMLLPYWGITGLARGGIARALALLAFALGGTALALALLGVLPEGLQPVAAAVGAGAVLGAFAYGALRTGSLLHGVVLLAPVVPLVIYALAQRPDDAGGVSTFLVVLAVVLGLMLLGSIPMAAGSVWVALDRLADRQGFVRPIPPADGSRRTRPRSFGRTVARRVLALVWVGLTALAWLAGLAVLVGAVWWLSRTDLLGWVEAHLWVWPLVLVAVLVCGWASDRTGRWMQVLGATGESDPPYRFAPVADARALSAGWAVVYAVGFALIAFVVSLPVWGEVPGPGRRTAFAACLAYAVLLLGLSLVLPWVAVGAAVRRECQRPLPPLQEGPPDVAARHREYALDLVHRGVAHRRFVGLTAEDALRLTEKGQALDRAVHHARAAADLERRWNAPRTLSEEDVARLAALLPSWETALGGNLGPQLRARVAKVRAALDGDADRGRVRFLVDRLLVALR
ncbi:patatin-like protein [Nocardioides sp. GXQ0305]|uniref:patatin-like protein n=1 Tax=Nocardioides sp. GXQ0305 TaxID=3423912 RepID=UPI003D7E027D